MESLGKISPREKDGLSRSIVIPVSWQCVPQIALTLIQIWSIFNARHGSPRSYGSQSSAWANGLRCILWQATERYPTQASTSPTSHHWRFGMVPSLIVLPNPANPSLPSVFPPTDLYYLASGFPAARLYTAVLRRIVLARSIVPKHTRGECLTLFIKFIFGGRGLMLRARAAVHGGSVRPTEASTGRDTQSPGPDNDPTTAFLGEEWYYLAPGFDASILQRAEIPGVSRRIGSTVRQDRNRRVTW